jgi:hypothetical protein
MTLPRLRKVGIVNQSIPFDAGLGPVPVAA